MLKLRRNCMLAGAVLVIMTILYYIWFCMANEMTSDCADTILWTKAMIDSGRIFSDTFGYAAYIPFGGQLIMYLFVKIFGVSMLAQRLSMTVFVIIFFAVLMLLLKKIFNNIEYITSGIMLMGITLCVSEKLREIFFGHIIYYSLGVLFFWVFIVLIEAIINGKNKKISISLLAIWTFLTATDDMLTLALSLVPAMAAVVFFWAVGDRKKDKECYIIIAVMLVLGVIGYKCGKNLITAEGSYYGEAYSTFSNSGKWADNLIKLIPHWYTLLGVNVDSGVEFASVNGIIALIRIVYATLIIISPVYMLINCGKIKNTTLKLTVYGYFAMTGILLIAWGFGKLSAANWRLSPIVCTAVILTIAMIGDMLADKDNKRLGILVVAGITVFAMSTEMMTLKLPAEKDKTVDARQLARILEDNNLEYGYATFWNAGVITLLSDSRVNVFNVYVDSDGVRKRLYQSESYWYEDKEGIEEYFLLLSRKEYEELAVAGNEKYMDFYDYIAFSDYYILIYDYNIMH